MNKQSKTNNRQVLRRQKKSFVHSSSSSHYYSRFWWIGGIKELKKNIGEMRPSEEDRNALRRRGGRGTSGRNGIEEVRYECGDGGQKSL